MSGSFSRWPPRPAHLLLTESTAGKRPASYLHLPSDARRTEKFDLRKPTQTEKEK